MASAREQYDELSFYTLAHGDPAFIHQHIVDAFIAQQASEHTKSIGLAFALIGLCLYLEKDYTGRQVQVAHMQLAKLAKEWPAFVPPQARGAVTVADVLAAAPGQPRDQMIRSWCASVWNAYQASHAQIRSIVEDKLSHL